MGTTKTWVLLGKEEPERMNRPLKALSGRGIDVIHADVEAIDPAKRSVTTSQGKLEADYLVLALGADCNMGAIPGLAEAAHRESGLTGAGGWVPVEPRTLECASGREPHRVLAIGDVTSVPLPGRFQPDLPLVLPKAGIFAERQAAAVASGIAADILGREPREVFVFDGTGYCYIEVGDDLAMRGDGSFFEMPHPVMTPREPDASQYAEKRRWVADWMAANL